MNKNRLMYKSSIDRITQIQEDISEFDSKIEGLRQDSKEVTLKINRLTEGHSLGEEKVAISRFLANSKAIEESNTKLALILDKRILETKRTTSVFEIYDEERLKVLKTNLVAANPLVYLCEFLMILLG